MSATLLRTWMEDLLASSPPRANSLIITLFGDAIAPHGGAVFLGDLINLVAPLRINERAVRTSVYRLQQENWLQSTPIGRRSEYRLTPSGQRRIAHAYRRIYDSPSEAWQGHWQIVILAEGALPAAAKDALRKELLWEGYGAIAPGVFALPADEADSLRELRELLTQSGHAEKVVVFRAQALDALTEAPLRELVEQCWHLDTLAADYQSFIERFNTPKRLLQKESRGDPEQHFMLRTLLIHEFRRVQLRDPQLPRALLPHNWPGHTAREICREIYTRSLRLSEAHLLATLSTGQGALPEADESLLERFSSLVGVN